MIDITSSSKDLTIPKNLFQIWVGPHPAPLKWMNTWKSLHPEWNYVIINDENIDDFKFDNRDVIDYFLKRGQYPGASDVIRYELLYQYGGFVPCSDSICYRNVDELFSEFHNSMAYVVHENETLRPDMFCPVYASTPNHPFLKELLNEISQLDLTISHIPYVTVGNMLVGKLLYKKTREDLIKFPSHYFVPNHFMGHTYTGTDKVYANQMWGTTSKTYNQGV
jgi:mannosyltransferase OCH1-like enzyme